MIRSANIADGLAIAEIYNWYIGNSHNTFEETTLSSQQMAQRIAEADQLSPWYVLEEDQQLIGFTYATRWKSRAAYRNSRESTIYLRQACSGQGWGRILYQHLIDEIKKTPIHVLIAGIALPNEASVALHEKLGFENIGCFQEVGLKFNKYIDVGYWQLTL